jgi:hypothetical protein
MKSYLIEEDKPIATDIFAGKNLEATEKLN